jgi:hypothetical protein
VSDVSVACEPTIGSSKKQDTWQLPVRRTRLTAFAAYATDASVATNQGITASCLPLRYK